MYDPAEGTFSFATADKVLHALRFLKPPRQETRDLVDKLCGYLRDNRDRMNYPAYRARGLRVSSMPVASGVGICAWQSTQSRQSARLRAMIPRSPSVALLTICAAVAALVRCIAPSSNPTQLPPKARTGPESRVSGSVATSSAVASAPPPAAVHQVPAVTARSLVEPIWRKLAGGGDSSAHLEGPDPEGSPQCSDGVCIWRLVVTAGDREEKGPLGEIRVDADNGMISWLPNDGTGRVWRPDDYLEMRVHANHAVSAVDALAEVRKYCDQLSKARQPVHCILWADNHPSDPCPTLVSLHDECLWHVYVGENQLTHTVRWATFIVHPQTFAVIGVSDTICGVMPYASWRKFLPVKYRLSNGEPQCPADARL